MSITKPASILDNT